MKHETKCAVRCTRRRGAVLLYVIIAFPVLIGFCALAIDLGRIQLAKAEAQTCADAASRYAAKGAASSATPITTARANATAVVAESRVDGAAPTLNTTDVVIGTFDPSTRVFIPDTIGDCVKVTVRQMLNRPGGVPLMMSMFSNTQMQVTGVAISRCVVTTTTVSPPAAGNLWLSGMPDNSDTQNMRPDNSTVWDNNGTSSDPKQRPLMIDIASLHLAGGATIYLEGLSGTASWQSGNSGTTNTADGDASFLVANGVAPASWVPGTSNNGMSNTRAPIGAVMGVFLSDDAPTLSSAPTNLDFGTSASRDFVAVSPQLKQVFFIGDGKCSSGETQAIVVPPGATRLYLGMMDAWQWNDNVGTFTTKLYGSSAIMLVK